MTVERYRQLLLDASRNRTRAKALLAEGGNAFDAAVRFRKAERLIREAEQLLEPSALAERIRLHSERALCLRDGFDPLGASRLRNDLLEFSAGEAGDLARTALRRLDSALAERLAQHQAFLIAAEHLRASAQLGRILPAPELGGRERGDPGLRVGPEDS